MAALNPGLFYAARSDDPDQENPDNAYRPFLAWKLPQHFLPVPAIRQISTISYQYKHPLRLHRASRSPGLSSQSPEAA
jgi:hypothetical protein